MIKNKNDDKWLRDLDEAIGNFRNLFYTSLILILGTNVTVCTLSKVKIVIYSLFTWSNNQAR